MLRKVQKRAVGMVLGLQERNYEGRLKIIHGTGGLDLSTWFAVVGDNLHATRATADSLNVWPKSGRLEVRRNFFSVQVSVHWKDIPASIKPPHNGECFKNEYKWHRVGLMQVAVH